MFKSIFLAALSLSAQAASAQTVRVLYIDDHSPDYITVATLDALKAYRVSGCPNRNWNVGDQIEVRHDGTMIEESRVNMLRRHSIDADTALLALQMGGEVCRAVLAK